MNTRWGDESGQGNEELYDHENDPEEYVNLANSIEYKNDLLKMREKFEEIRRNARKEVTSMKN